MLPHPRLPLSLKDLTPDLLPTLQTHAKGGKTLAKTLGTDLASRVWVPKTVLAQGEYSHPGTVGMRSSITEETEVITRSLPWKPGHLA